MWGFFCFVCLIWYHLGSMTIKHEAEEACNAMSFRKMYSAGIYWPFFQLDDYLGPVTNMTCRNVRFAV